MQSFKYSCNCPDSSKQRTFSANPTSFSTSFNQDWSKTNAGAQGGICKHIWATRLIRKEITKEDIPTDVPIPLEEDDNSQSQELYQQGYGGNSFYSPETFSVPGFQSYKGG